MIKKVRENMSTGKTKMIRGYFLFETLLNSIMLGNNVILTDNNLHSCSTDQGVLLKNTRLINEKTAINRKLIWSKTAEQFSSFSLIIHLFITLLRSLR